MALGRGRQAPAAAAAGSSQQGTGQEPRSARWFAQLFEQTSDAVFVVGSDFRVVWWGPRAEELLGVPAEAAVGQRCFELIAGRHGAGQAECGPGCWVMRAARRGRSVPPFRIQVRGPAMERRWYSLGLMRDQDGTFLVHLLRPQELATPPTEARGRHAPRLAQAPPDSPLDWLTPRERDVLRLIVAGATGQEIAQRLSISHATARNHVQNVLMKLGVHSRLEAAIVAVQAGLEPVGAEARGV